MHFINQVKDRLCVIRRQTHSNALFWNGKLWLESILRFSVFSPRKRRRRGKNNGSPTPLKLVGCKILSCARKKKENNETLKFVECNVKWFVLGLIVDNNGNDSARERQQNTIAYMMCVRNLASSASSSTLLLLSVVCVYNFRMRIYALNTIYMPFKWWLTTTATMAQHTNTTVHTADTESSTEKRKRIYDFRV